MGVLAMVRTPPPALPKLWVEEEKVLVRPSKGGDAKVYRIRYGVEQLLRQSKLRGKPMVGPFRNFAISFGRVVQVVGSEFRYYVSLTAIVIT